MAGFGFGALLWIKLTQGFIFGPVKLTGDWTGLYGMGWTVNQVFLLYGVLFAVLVAAGSLVLVNPPEGWRPKGWTPTATQAASHAENFEPRQMLKSSQFWGLALTFFFGSTAGLMVIGLIERFGNDKLTTGGYTPEQAILITGTAMGLFYAFFNGLGRIAWGALSDSLGRRHSIAIMSALQGVMMISFYWVGGTEWGLYLGSAIIGFNYGGCFALFPAATADLFGNKNVGSNYPYVFLAYGLGGIVGPQLGGFMKDLGEASGDITTWLWAFIPAGIACLVGAIIMWTLRRPRSHTAPVPVELPAHAHV